MENTWKLTPWYLRLFQRRPTFRRLEEKGSYDAMHGQFPDIWSFSWEPWNPQSKITSN